MHSKTMDALTYVRVFGKPSLFITMTASPKWSEIQENLFEGQKSQDREDIGNNSCKTVFECIF